MSRSDGTFGPIPDDWSQPLHEPPHATVVDGETWVVRQRTDEPGTYDFEWVSGPNEGYGFTSASSDESASTATDLDDSIRLFLTMIDPATGYISDE